jgi:hypothetical protein
MEVAVIRKSFRDKPPELSGMVQFSKMAYFVNDNIIGKTGWQMDDAVIEVEITLAGTAPPAGLLIFYRNAGIWETEPLAPVSRPIVRQS